MLLPANPSSRRALLAAFALPLFAAESSARQKLRRIEEGRAGPGWVSFSLNEVNALAAEEIEKAGLAGVRAPMVELGTGSATGSAYIDFAKVRESATGEAPGGIGRALLGGEKLVSVEAVFRSGEGLCTIDPQRVSVNGLEIRGRVLDWLIEHYLLSLYPTAKVGRPFEMDHGIERVEISPSRVRLRVA